MDSQSTITYNQSGFYNGNMQWGNINEGQLIKTMQNAYQHRLTTSIPEDLSYENVSSFIKREILT